MRNRGRELVFADFPAGSLFISVALVGIGVYGLFVLLPVESHPTVPVPLIVFGLLLASLAITAGVRIVLRAEYTKVTWDEGKRIIHAERFWILKPSERKLLPVGEIVDVVVSQRPLRRGANGYGISFLTRSKEEVVITGVWTSRESHRLDAVARLRAWLTNRGGTMPRVE